MAGEVLASVTSLFGVFLGGGLSFMVQRTTQRSAERVEVTRQTSARAAARRDERVAVIREFIAQAQAAERAAIHRPDNWDPDEWYPAAQSSMDSLWVAERTIHVLCAPSLHAPARAYAEALNHVVWQERTGIPVWEYLEPSRLAFLNAARQGVDDPA